MDLDVHADSLALRPNEYRGFVHKRILGAARGFASGGFAGAALGFSRSTRPTTPVRAMRQVPPPQRRSTTTTVQKFGPFGIGGSRTTSVSSITIPAGTGRAAAEIVGEVLDRRARGPVAPTADGCPKGFHLNKSSYTLKSGDHIEERTLCVKNRRRNNDNGAAAMRAARRLIGRKKSQDTIDKALRAIAPPSRRRSQKHAPHGGPVVIAAG